MATIRVRSRGETFNATIVEADPRPQPQWYGVRFVGSSGHESHAVFRFTLRRNGRYVAEGADRDTGSYLDEGDLRAD